ncbi:MULTISPECIES: hypothetical protein [unclassified Bradyrhizobium]|uniref:hypothetical protein n=1 Tax=unclassified Bradyrhizobium TaxID=2631580 RepID=UPI001FFB9A8C|nr:MULTISPECIES: hypothetical protein [unclassified Bradyrhizobium]MCK1424595.1 hypothetical protein [Bradyrhizobium sp. CW12]MCK1646458.1 hypothetical protein [Bradyrhizobium sp. 154]MCK1758753.1 hypothetical protein [Bradyrhizobium sp. 137]
MDDQSAFRESVIREIDQLRARQIATEAMVTQVLALLCVKAGPNISAELIDQIRRDLHVQEDQPNDPFVLLVEEFVAKLADKIERQVRVMMGANR